MIVLNIVSSLKLTGSVVFGFPRDLVTAAEGDVQKLLMDIDDASKTKVKELSYAHLHFSNRNIGKYY